MLCGSLNMIIVINMTLNMLGLNKSIRRLLSKMLTCTILFETPCFYIASDDECDSIVYLAVELTSNLLQGKLNLSGLLNLIENIRI